jgi:hypothetical protein
MRWAIPCGCGSWGNWRRNFACGLLKDVKELLISEWNVGGYQRELDLPVGVDGERANITYENGVLVVMLPISEHTHPARLRLEPVGRARGQRVGSTGNSLQPTTTAEHQARQAAHPADRDGSVRRSPG